MARNMKRVMVDLTTPSEFNNIYHNTITIAKEARENIDKSFSVHHSDLSYINYVDDHISKLNQTRGRYYFNEELKRYLKGLYHSKRVGTELKSEMNGIQFAGRAISHLTYDKDSQTLTMDIYGKPVVAKSCIFDFTAPSITITRMDMMKDGTTYIHYKEDTNIDNESTSINQVNIPQSRKLLIVGSYHAVYLSNGIILPHPKTLTHIYTSYKKEKSSRGIVSSCVTETLNKTIRSYAIDLVNKIARKYNLAYIGIDERLSPCEITNEHSNGLWPAIVDALVKEFNNASKSATVIGLNTWRHNNIASSMEELHNRLVKDGSINRNYRLLEMVDIISEYDEIKLNGQ